MSTDPQPTPTPAPSPAPTPSPTPEPAPAPSLVNGDGTKTDPPAPAPKPEALTKEGITIPEGFQADDATVEKFLGIANELGLSKEGANKLVGLQAELAKAASEAGSKLWEDTQKQWQDQVRADPEIGGTKLEENLSVVAKLLDTYGSPAVKQAFDLTGAGNNPEIIRFLIKVGRELGEGTPVSGGPGTAPQTAASLLYPNQGKQ